MCCFKFCDTSEEHEFVFKVRRSDARQVRADLQYRTQRALKAEGIIKSEPSPPLEALGMDVKPDFSAIANEDMDLDVKPNMDADGQAYTEDAAFLDKLENALDLLREYEALPEETHKKVAERLQVSLFVFSLSRLIRRLAGAEWPGS